MAWRRMECLVAQGEGARRGTRLKRRRRMSQLVAEQFEKRLALAAVPSATVSGPTAPLLGEEIDLVVTFDNTATDPADIGYSPFVDIVMPKMGDAPPAPTNGIEFKPGSATYNGLALQTTVLEFDANGQATHPFAKNPDGSPVIVTGTPGDQLVVVQLPFGSYGPDQPAADIEFTGIVSDLAQPNHSYAVTATGGFRYQTDVSGNPTIDVADFGTTTTDPIQPQLFRVTKTSGAPESETATGPNFAHTYTVSMAVAPGQTVTDLTLSDVLPDDIQFVSVGTVSGNGSTTITPLATPSGATPGGTLSRRFDQISGTGSNSDVQMTFSYFVPQKDAGGADVIPLGTGGTAVITNTAAAAGTWTSANPNFPNPQAIASDPTDPAASATITARTVALQKSFANLTNPGSARAGDTIEYTLYFQVSDFFALDDLVLTDVLSDGQEFDATFTPTISFTQQSESVSGGFDPANYSTTVETNGTETVAFDVSSELANLGLTTGTQVLGAGVPPGGTGDPATLPDATPTGPGTTGTIKFRAKILNKYRVTPRPNADVVQGDRMSDVAELDGDVLDYATLTNVVGEAGDGSSKSFTLVSGGATKTVYAVNGNPVSGSPVVTAGDAVTFRLTYSLPFSRIKDYQITDFLPLPIFAAQGLTFAGGGPSSTAPGAGQWSFGPTDTFSQPDPPDIGGPVPTTSFSGPANSITWDFGTFADDDDVSSVTDILFTVTATNRPFGDGFLLTNQMQQTERNETDDLIASNTALAQVQISEPLLGITKGVVSTNNAAGVFSPTPSTPAGVTFSAPGQPGAAFTGTITSGGLATTPIDATLSNVLGNDLVKFTIIVENTGSGSNGAFDVAVRDTFDATKFQIPTSGTGLNLQVTDGTGTALAYTGTPTDLFGTGIQLVDPGASTGSLAAGNPSSGTNIAVISYDLQLLPTVAPSDVIPNTATVTNYASTEGGPNFLPPAGISDDTTVTVQAPEITKSLIGTSIIDTWNSNTQAVIGELATFSLTIDVPRGTTPSAVVVDSLPAGLAFKQMVGTPVIDPDISFTGSLAPVVTDNGRTVTFNLGDVTNASGTDMLQGVTLQYEAVVLNVSSNTAGRQLRNNAKLTWTGHTELPTAQSGAVTVIEPKLTVAKTVSPTTAQANDTATFTIVVSASQTTSHNVSLDDFLPAGVTYVPGTLIHTAGVVPTTLATSGGGRAFEAVWAQLTPGQTSTLTFQTTLDADVTSGEAITNAAAAEWTSLPGNPGQITPNNPHAYERTGTGSTTQGQLNNYKTSDSATITVAVPTVAKSLVSTSIVNAANSNTQAVIGELATYDVTVTIPQGRTPAAELIDRMAPGLAFVQQISAVNNDPSVLTVPGLSNPPTLSAEGTLATWDLGDIVNTDTDSATAETITFQIQTVVLNVNSNTAGVALNNRARLFWNDRSNFSNNAQNRQVTVIEPKLKTTKTAVVGGLGGNPGDPVTYTIVIQQDPTSQTDAFDATLNDILPPEIASPSITAVVDTAGVVTDANFQLAAGTLSTTTPFDIEKNPSGRTITLTVEGTLQGPFTANQQIVNTNYVRWTSLNGSPGQITSNNPNAYERTGSGATNQGELNNYVASGTATIDVNTADLAVTKTVDNPAPNVGDTITFTVTVSNNGPDAATQVEVTDTFPTAGLQIVGTPTVSQGTYDSATGVWDIGTVLAGGGNAQTLAIQALVLAPAVNTIPVAQTNTAEISNAAEPDPNLSNNRDDATETPKYADLGVKKTTSNPTPNVGSTVTYTVSLFNLGTSATTGVKLTDSFPANVTYVTHSTASGTFDPATGIWDVGTVPLTATVSNPLTLTIDVTADTASTGFNIVTITDSDVWDPNTRNNSAKTPTTGQEADLIMSKTVNDASPNVGNTLTYTLTIDNTGPSLADNVVVTDTIPAGITFVSASNGGTYDAATREVTWSLGDDFPLGQTQLTVQATVDTPTSGTIPAIVNTATVTSTTTDPNPDNNTDDKEIVPLQTDLAVFKVVSDSTPNVGDSITYTISAANFGPDAATNVVVSDVLPVGVTFVSATESIGTATYDADARTVTWTIGTLNTTDFPTLDIVVAVDAPSPAGVPPTATNSATVTGDEYDPDPTNNTDSVDETPQYADLEVTKQVSDATPNVGDTITYTITVTNNGADTATNVTLLDTLQTLTGLQITGTPQANFGTFDQATGIWTISTLNVGVAATLSIQAEVLAPASGIPPAQTNTASIQTVDQYDPDPTNNSDSATETLQYADLKVTKTVSNPAPNVGANVTFTIEVENLGADPATNVTIDDVLPAGLSFVSASSQSYDPGTGEWVVGTVGVGAGNAQTLTITATVAQSGSFTNTAAVSTTAPPDQYDPDLTNNSDSASVTTREADLVVTKTVSNAAPNVGDVITFTITVANNGPDSANNVEITDTFPTAGLQLISGTPSQGSFDTGTGVWTVGTIEDGAGNEQTLTLLARVLAPAVNTIPPSQTNTATVTNVDEHDPNPGNETGQVTETPQYADLAVTKVTSNVQPNVGDIFTYTVTLENLGTATATNVEVTEVFPNNIEVVSITPTNTHITTRFDQTATGGVWSVPTIASGDLEVLVIVARATNASVAFNTVEITHSDVWDPNDANNSSRTPTDPQQADLFMKKEVDNPRPEVGDEVTFTLTLENLGPTDAQSVVVDDVLPAGLEFVSANPVGVYNDATGVWTVGTLAAGATTTLDIVAKVLEPGSGSGPVSPSTNTATATSPTVDPNPGNNTGKSTVTPLGADLAVIKTASNLTPQIGTEFTYTIEVSNNGPDTASNVEVQDQLPADLIYVDHATTVGTYDEGTGIWDVGTVTTADRPELVIIVRVNTGNSGGLVTNTATVDSGTWDPDLSNNTSTIDVDVPPRGVIVGTDIGCETGPFVRVIDPDTGADVITPFFAYEPSFRGGVRVYGADVTGDGVPEIITAPGPGRPGEVKVFSETGTPLPEYSFFPFGPAYDGGIEIAAGSITSAGTIQIVAGQGRGGTVSVFDVTPGAATPVAGVPTRQVQPFGPAFRGGVSVATADIGTFSGTTLTSNAPDGIDELVFGSGPGRQATVNVYNGVPLSPALLNTFNPIATGYNRGISVSVLPSSTRGNADKIMVAAGTAGNGLVETYSGLSGTREAAFQAFGGGRAAVFAAAIDDSEIFSVQGLGGSIDGVSKNTSPSGGSSGILPQSTVAYPPLRVGILRP
jgi:large repetitive protein